MNGKNAPRGLVVTVAVAFLVGVFVPSVNLEANLSGQSGESESGAGSFEETHGPGGFPEGNGANGPDNGRDADPDWPTPGGWSIDYVLVSPREQDLRVPVIGPLGQLFDWLLHQIDSEYVESITTTVLPRR